jgi:hypothetical protein
VFEGVGLGTEIDLEKLAPYVKSYFKC